MFQRQEKSICCPFNRFYCFSLFQFIQSQYLEFHILSGRIWFAKMCHAPGNQTSVIVINKQKSIFVPLSHFSCFSLFQSIQWTHLFTIQYQCSQFQSFPLCVFEEFCRVLTGLVMWKVLTSWGFCGCFDDWQNHHWTRANQCHFNSAFLGKAVQLKSEIIFCNRACVGMKCTTTYISTRAVTTICLIWQIWLESGVWNGGQLHWRWSPLSHGWQPLLTI